MKVKRATNCAANPFYFGSKFFYFVIGQEEVSFGLFSNIVKYGNLEYSYAACIFGNILGYWAACISST
jgi:hypothetical protein